MDYKLRGKSLEEIKAEDISDLIDEGIEEGLFIEYKSEEPHGNDLIKELTSLANSYGGYLFLGISEDEGKPEEVVGLDRNPENLRKSIRDRLCTQITPIPDFQVKVIDVDGDQVLVVRVFKSDRKPHIHNQGKVYIRKSESKRGFRPLENHSELQMMFREKEDFEKAKEEFIEEGSFDGPHLQVDIIPSTFRDKLDENREKLVEEFEGLKRAYNQIIDHSRRKISFNLLKTTSDGVKFVDREYYGGLELRFNFDGSAKAIIPLREEDGWKEGNVDFMEQEAFEEFDEMFDGHAMLSHTIAIFNLYLNSVNNLKDSDRIRNFEVKMSINGAKGYLPSFKDTAWFERPPNKFPVITENDKKISELEELQYELRDVDEDDMKDILSYIMLELGFDKARWEKMVEKRLKLRDRR
ncbi:helix-turn-helix domain-containing protein [Candidatus Nanohalococcus occultus]|uniref:AlbA family DNA-binding domain-containing protein n=1 Tax=Candidatus Nanohalococcus occultus TaxID=2978047 RepID=UPI0039E194A4